MCVGVRGTRVSVQVSINLELPPIIGNCGVIGHLCLIDFILLRYIKKNGLEPEMGSGVRLSVGKVLDTQRHSLKNGYLLSSIPLCLLSMDVGLN